MARGDQLAADSVSEQTGKKIQDYNADQLTVLLASNTFAAAADFTNISQFTEVTGTGYTRQNVTGTYTRSANSDISELQAGDASWAQNAGGPVDCRVAVLHNSQAGVVGNDDVITVVDLTTDGTTPVSLQAGALNVNFSNSVTMRVKRQ